MVVGPAQAMPYCHALNLLGESENTAVCYVVFQSQRTCSYFCGTLGFVVDLEALYHTVRTDCLLIEAACAHSVNQHWVWWMADKFTCTFKSAAYTAGRLTF